MGKCYIRPIPLTKGLWPKSMWTYRMNFGDTCTACTYVWSIEGTKSNILVDGGVKAELYHAKGDNQEDVVLLEDGLRKLKLRPEDIEIVILTHLHWDHVALASMFTKAKFIVQKAELDFARNPHPAAASGYNKTYFENLNMEIIEGDKEIVDGVKVLLTPGHTPGSQSVSVDTPKGTAIITGFCCTLDNFELSPEAKAKGMEIVTPGIHIDVLKAYDSALKVKRAANIVIALHDEKFMNKNRIPE